ncbi:hypothetical protein ASG67_05490 [Sphingomonas sp. Leaf339]|uniref:hypothetical protein n=1 Tax=Sphingomonas sp. Leaf339 TaxID=1736343 RepID=UPI0006FBF16F|nr:hypothetical protein [Sphingomonas sp. Leaf339]KQU55601.1 hypothetical protein ASG67_05490 [Sphingomonas sp. Leaf339]
MRHARIVASASTTALVVSGYALGGAVAVVATLILMLPALALAFDNRSGTFFIIALLIVIVFVVLLGLLSLMAIVH